MNPNTKSNNGDTLTGLQSDYRLAKAQYFKALKDLELKKAELIPFQDQLASTEQRRLNIATRIGIWSREMNAPYVSLD